MFVLHIMFMIMITIYIYIYIYIEVLRAVGLVGLHPVDAGLGGVVHEVLSASIRTNKHIDTIIIVRFILVLFVLAFAVSLLLLSRGPRRGPRSAAAAPRASASPREDKRACKALQICSSTLLC